MRLSGLALTPCLLFGRRAGSWSGFRLSGGHPLHDFFTAVFVDGFDEELSCPVGACVFERFDARPVLVDE